VSECEGVSETAERARMLMVKGDFYNRD